MRGRATRLQALDTYFMLDDEDDEDGEKHSGVSDGEDKGEGREEREQCSLYPVVKGCSVLL